MFCFAESRTIKNSYPTQARCVLISRVYTYAHWNKDCPPTRQNVIIGNLLLTLTKQDSCSLWYMISNFEYSLYSYTNWANAFFVFFLFLFCIGANMFSFYFFLVGVSKSVPPWYKWNIVESGVKRHNLNPRSQLKSLRNE